jgi:hypothetical protein
MIEKIASLAVVMLIVVGATLAARQSCADEIVYTESNFGQVECCCATITGGTCCGIVSFCSSFIPGCMCK